MAEQMTVGRASDVPEGEMRSFQVGGEDIAVANVDGAWYAFGDVCTHKHCSLSDGELEGTTVTCPCHGSQFDVTNGEVLNPPATEPVDSYQVDVSDGELKISF
ncbi:MAG TPA: non-heme iron oxygenase ferredoxin subunit [Actinomycetota bacterium]|nr:non-heme iron oxygenase ferredoxin subunit [Actinomycetota bacterium]